MTEASARPSKDFAGLIPRLIELVEQAWPTYYPCEPAADLEPAARPEKAA